jgi:hypothetical protein
MLSGVSLLLSLYESLILYLFNCYVLAAVLCRKLDPIFLTVVSLLLSVVESLMVFVYGFLVSVPCRKLDPMCV